MDYRDVTGARTTVGERERDGWSSVTCSDSSGNAGQEQEPNTETHYDFLSVTS